MKVHIMRWAVQDWRTSRVRARSARTDDLALRTIYLELLFALHEAGGELPADPEALADDLMLPAEEIARCLPILDRIARQPGARGGILVEAGVIRNARVSEDLGRTEAWLAAQSEAGKASGAARKPKVGSSRVNDRSTETNDRSTDHERPFNDRSTETNAAPTTVEPAVAVAVAVAKPVPMPEPSQDNAPPGPPAAAGGTCGVGEPPGEDTLPDGTVVLERDELGPVVVRRPPRATVAALRPDVGAAVDRLIGFASTHLGYRFDRNERRRLRDRLLGGETEAQIQAGYDRTLAALQECEEAPQEAGEDPPDELADALRLLPPAAESGGRA